MRRICTNYKKIRKSTKETVREIVRRKKKGWNIFLANSIISDRIKASIGENGESTVVWDWKRS